MEGILVNTSYAGMYTYKEWCVQTEKGKKHFCAIYISKTRDPELDSVSVEDCGCELPSVLVPDDVVRMAEGQTVNI